MTRCVAHCHALTVRPAKASGSNRRLCPSPSRGWTLSRLPLKRLDEILKASPAKADSDDHPEKVLVVKRIGDDPRGRLDVLLDLGLGYLTLERSTPTLSSGELQRLRLATQVRSNLFGIVYGLDEPSAGLHPAHTEALLRAMARSLRATRYSSSSTNST
jgi:excinuclease UvrABC ATPase subunit